MLGLSSSRELICTKTTRARSAFAAGNFLRVPGGHKHWSGGDKKKGAVFYEEFSGKFDFIPAK